MGVQQSGALAVAQQGDLHTNSARSGPAHQFIIIHSSPATHRHQLFITHLPSSIHHYPFTIIYQRYPLTASAHMLFLRLAPSLRGGGLRRQVLS